MGNPNYELLDDWHAYCQDEAEFADGHFDTLLMELLYDFGDAEQRFVASVCKHFAHGKRLAQILCKAGAGVNGLTDRQINGRLKKHATGDIGQKLPLLKVEKQARLAKRIAKLPVLVTDYATLLAAKEESELQEEFELHVSNAIASKAEYDPWQSVLSNAVYYGFANDLRFQQIFDTYMLDALEPLCEDFELWRIGGEYVITDSEIFVSKVELVEYGLDW